MRFDDVRRNMITMKYLHKIGIRDAAVSLFHNIYQLQSENVQLIDVRWEKNHVKLHVVCLSVYFPLVNN